MNVKKFKIDLVGEFKFMKIKIILSLLMISILTSPLNTLAQDSAPKQQESEGSGLREFFRTLLFCGPGNRMCDPKYNPDGKALIESPEDVINFFSNLDKFLDNRRESNIVQKPPVASAPYVASVSKIAVTASPPTRINPPLDNEAFHKLLKANSPLANAVQGYLQKKPESIPSLRLYAEAGDPFAQLFFGLAYADTWTGIQDPAESCRWIRESASAGVSSARFFMAQRAYLRAPCFSQPPTLEQARIWADLASQSNDPSVKKDSQQLTLEILKDQIAGKK